MNTIFPSRFPHKFEGPGVSFLFAVILLVLFAVLLFVALVPGLSGGSGGTSWNGSNGHYSIIGN